MKKVFLTSGVVLCLALPAYATTDISSSANSASCVEDTLGVDSGSTEFEAIWNAQSWTNGLTYACGTDAPGTAPSPQTVTYDSNVTLASTANSCTKDGHHFNNTWTCTNGVGERAAGATVSWTYVGGAVCTAGWAANTTTVTYSCNGGTGNPGTPASVTATYGQGYTYAGVGTCANTGQTFGGWNCGVAGASKSAGASEPWSYTGADGGSITCNAIWGNATYTITYSCGNAPDSTATIPGTQTNWPATASGTITSGVLPTGSVTYGDTTVSIAAATGCTLEGWAFSGWDCVGNGVALSNVTGTVSHTWNYSNGMTCTPHWTQNSINLTWNDNGATTAHVGGGASCSYDGNITLPTPPQRTGYTFGGWTVAAPANPLLSVSASTPGTAWYYKVTNAGQDSPICQDSDGNDACTSAFDDLGDDEFKVVFSYGTVYGKVYGKDVYSVPLNSTLSDPGTENPGAAGLCKVTAFKPTSGNKQNISGLLWVGTGNHNDTGAYEQNGYDCGNLIKTDATFRAIAYGQSGS